MARGGGDCHCDGDGNGDGDCDGNGDGNGVSGGSGGDDDGGDKEGNKDESKPWPRRGQRFVDKADERGDAHHRGVASCLNSINHDVSINASFSFNTI